MVMMEQKMILNYMPRRAKMRMRRKTRRLMVMLVMMILTCMPRRAKMRMKRKRRRRSETMDFMEASKETTRFLKDDQYLGKNKFQEEKITYLEFFCGTC